MTVLDPLKDRGRSMDGPGSIRGRTGVDPRKSEVDPLKNRGRSEEERNRSVERRWSILGTRKLLQFRGFTIFSR